MPELYGSAPAPADLRSAFVEGPTAVHMREPAAAERTPAAAAPCRSEPVWARRASPIAAHRAEPGRPAALVADTADTPDRRPRRWQAAADSSRHKVARAVRRRPADSPDTP